jgi:hypothetical protein
MIRSRSPIWLVWGATLASMVLGCSSDRPSDMWITKDPDAGAGWEAPPRETGEDSATGVAGSEGTGGTGGDGTAGTTGIAGSDSAGTTGVGGDVTGGGGSSAAGTGGIGGSS